MTKTTTHRKMVEVGRKRIPMKKLLHGKEIRDAAKALEDYRLHLNEAEFLFGAKITIVMGEYGEATAVAKRPETDNEYADRIEKARLAAEAKKEREKKRQLAEAEKARRDAETRKIRTAEHVKQLIKANGLSSDELIDFLNK